MLKSVKMGTIAIIALGAFVFLNTKTIQPARDPSSLFNLKKNIDIFTGIDLTKGKNPLENVYLNPIVFSQYKGFRIYKELDTPTDGFQFYATSEGSYVKAGKVLSNCGIVLNGKKSELEDSSNFAKLLFSEPVTIETMFTSGQGAEKIKGKFGFETDDFFFGLFHITTFKIKLPGTEKAYADNIFLKVKFLNKLTQYNTAIWNGLHENEDVKLFENPDKNQDEENFHVLSCFFDPSAMKDKNVNLQAIMEDLTSRVFLKAPAEKIPDPIK